MPNTNRTKVIILHSQKDAKHLERLRIHLAFYEEKELIDVWDSTNILPSTIRSEEFKKALSSAKVAILLVNADFLVSRFIKDELPYLLDTQVAEGAIILSVITDPCAFRDTELAAFQAVNNPLKPLNFMNRPAKEKVWSDLAECVKNTTLVPVAKKETFTRMNNPQNQLAVVNKLFLRFFYRDDSTINDLLSQLDIQVSDSGNATSKLKALCIALTQSNALQQLTTLNQNIYDNIQLGQILEIKGKARLSQWEETTDKITYMTGLNEVVKNATGQDLLQNALKEKDAQQGYQGITSLMEKNKSDDTILIIKPLNAVKFQFVAKLDHRYVHCSKDDLKTEFTILGVVQRKIAPNETIDVFRLIPDISSLENMNRENRRKAKRNDQQVTALDDIIRYPAINIYPVAIYLP